MKIKEYEIVESVTDEENYEYEEMTFGELLEKADLSDEEKHNFYLERFSTNIHIMISLESFDNIMETLQDRLTDERLSKLKAIVLLSLKRKGRGVNFTPLPLDKFKQIVDFALKHEIGIGFDSCSAFKFLQSVEGHKNYDQFEMHAEPCESTAFSSYINAEGKFFPCSFAEGHNEWEEGINVLECDNFVKDVWNNERTQQFRKNLLATTAQNHLGCRECPLFEI